MEDAATQTERPRTPPTKVGLKTQSVQTDKINLASVERDEESLRSNVRRVPQKLGGSAPHVKQESSKRKTSKESVKQEKRAFELTGQDGDDSSQGSRSSSRSSGDDSPDEYGGQGQVLPVHGDPSDLYYQVVDCGLSTQLTWEDVPEVLVRWLKLNLFQKQQSDLYCGEWVISDIEHFDVPREDREKMVDDFEQFLLEVMCLVRPGKHEQRRGLRQRYRRLATGDVDKSGHCIHCGHLVQCVTSDDEGHDEIIRRSLDDSPLTRKLEEEQPPFLQGSGSSEHICSTTDLKGPLMHIQSAVSLQSIQSAVSNQWSVAGDSHSANIASAATLPTLSPTGMGSNQYLSTMASLSSLVGNAEASPTARQLSLSITKHKTNATLEECSPTRPSTSGGKKKMQKLTSSHKNFEMQGVALGPIRDAGVAVGPVVGTSVVEDPNALNISDILGFQPPQAQFRDSAKLPVHQDPFVKPYASDQGLGLKPKREPETSLVERDFDIQYEPAPEQPPLPEPEPAPGIDDTAQSPKQRELITDTPLPFDIATQAESEGNFSPMASPTRTLKPTPSLRSLYQDESVDDRSRKSCEILAQRLNAMRLSQNGLRAGENEVSSWLTDLDAVDPHAVAQIQAVEAAAATSEAGRAQFQHNIADVQRQLKELVKGPPSDNSELIYLSRRLVGNDDRAVEIMSSALQSLIDVSKKRKTASESLMRFAFTRLKRLRGTLPTLPPKAVNRSPTWTQTNLCLVSKTSEKTPRQGAARGPYSPLKDKTPSSFWDGDSRPTTARTPRMAARGGSATDFIGSIAWSYSKSPSGSSSVSTRADRSSSLSQPNRSRTLVVNQPMLIPGGGVAGGGNSSDRPATQGTSRYKESKQSSRPQTTDATSGTGRRLMGGIGNITQTKKPRWAVIPDEQL